MKDRVPVNPGRVLITPENGAAAYYATMTRADNPTQEGDPLNKNTLLKDATAALLGGNADMVPDEALVALKTLIDDVSINTNKRAKISTGSYVGTGTTGYPGKKIIFPFPPQMVLIIAKNKSIESTAASWGRWNWLVALNGMTKITVASYAGYSCSLNLTWTENELLYYADNHDYESPADQLDILGETYLWFVIS